MLCYQACAALVPEYSVFPGVSTLQLLLETLHLRIGIIDSLVELDMQGRILVRHVLVQELLVVNVLGGLVGPEAESSASTLHDDVGAQTAQDARLVVFAGVEVGDDGIVGVGKLGPACRAVGASVGALVSDAERAGTLDAEDMAAGGDEGAIRQLVAAFEVVAGQGVLHGGRLAGFE